MIEDEIVREVRQAREAFAATCNYDVRAMVHALHELGVASGRNLVRLPARVPVTAPVPTQPQSAAVLPRSQTP